jgi:4-amino-4-deoxychorismate lyase
VTCWINGRAGTLIDCRDRGFNYGDGAFETMRVRRHQIRLLTYHLQRLDEACRRLGLRAPDGQRLRDELERIASRRAEAVLKLVVTRGTGGRGYRPTGRERGLRVISLNPLPREPPAPARARLCATRLGMNPSLAGLKTLNRLESVLARAEWTDPRIWEGLMRDTDDHIVCGTMTNFFIRRGSSLITPRLDRCGIAGVMRRWVLEHAARAGLHTREARVEWRDLDRADEAFMTNAIIGIMPLAAVQHGRIQIRFPERCAAADLSRLLERP